jgi:hypothetical protein
MAKKGTRKQTGQVKMIPPKPEPETKPANAGGFFGDQPGEARPAEPTPEAQPPEAPPELKPAEITVAEISLPLAGFDPTEYCTRHIESRLNTEQQRQTFKRLYRGLQQQGKTLLNGRPVNRAGDVLRWIMEQV